MIARFLKSALFVAPLLVVQTVAAQTSELKGASKWADTAYREIEAGSDAGDIARLKAARTLLDRALIAFPNDALLLHYKGYELHREASLQEGLSHHDEVGPLLDEAQAVLERSLEIKPMPETHALLSSIIGRQIALHPWKAMILGPRSGTAMTNAIAIGPNNPRVWLLRGIGAMFTPKAFGGGLDNSESYLKKAELLFANDHPAPPAPAWGKAEVYAWLGQIYQKQGKNTEAIAAYNKALDINPGFHWVRSVLLPSAQRR
jgi:tetratricopeptide (TPR) repeat protein